jgi:formyltetrahydrofolate synthetase
MSTVCSFLCVYCHPLFSSQAKIEAIACGTYGASGVSYSPEAEAAIAKFTAMGFDRLPICMAKTQYSFSHDATLKGERCSLGLYAPR